MPDIAKALWVRLEAEFFRLLTRKDQYNIESKLKVVRAPHFYVLFFSCDLIWLTRFCGHTHTLFINAVPSLAGSLHW